MNNLNFDLKQLRSFLAVIEEKSFTNASRKLKVGQATISHHINQLEETLGVKLMERNSKKIELTRHGKNFSQMAEKLFSELEDVHASFQEHAERGTSVIAASTIPSTYLLPRAIAQVKKDYPSFSYSILVSDSRETVELLKDGTAELGVVGNRIANPLLTYKKLFHGEIILVGDSSMKKTMSPEEIKDLPLIMREPGSGTRKACERALKEHRILPSSLNIVHETSTSESVRESVAAGIGAAFISRYAVQDYLENGKLHKIKVKGLSIPHQFFALWHTRKELSSPAHRLMSVLQEISAKSH